jgi:hypothetical protein
MTMTPGLLAIGCLVPVSSWWFMQTGGLSASGAAINAASLQAIKALLLLQFLSICLFSPQWIADSENRPAQRFTMVEVSASLAAFALPAWPLLAMLALASEVSAAGFAVAQVAVLVTGILLASISRGIDVLVNGEEIARLSRLLLGIIAASLVWVFRLELYQWTDL